MEDEPVVLSWSVVLGFLRIATNQRILARALAVVDGWLAQPNVRLLPPGDEH
jgi:hypothetical protein